MPGRGARYVTEVWVSRGMGGCSWRRGESRGVHRAALVRGPAGGGGVRVRDVGSVIGPSGGRRRAAGWRRPRRRAGRAGLVVRRPPDRRLGRVLGRDPVDRAGRRDRCRSARRRPRARAGAGRGLRPRGGAGARRGRAGDRALDGAPRLRRRQPTDIHALHAHWARRARGRLGELPPNTPVAELLLDGDGAVAGVVAGEDDERRRARCCSPPAASRATRSSCASSAGTPTRCSCAPTAAAPATASGGRVGGRGGQPGRDVLRPHGAAPLGAFEPGTTCRWRSTTQWCVLVNRLGRRYTDESLGDEVANQMTLRQPGARGVLLCDERVRRERVIGAPYPHGQVIDRFERARSPGARIAGLSDAGGARRDSTAAPEAADAAPDARCCASRRSGRSSSSRRSRSPSAACADPGAACSTRDGGCSACTRRRRRGRAPGPALRRRADARHGVRPAGRGGSDEEEEERNGP